MTTETLCSDSGFEQALADGRLSDSPRYTVSQRLRSCYHALWYSLGEQLRWSRGVYCEQPVGHISRLSRGQQTRIDLLRRRFDARFEEHCAALTSLKNYDYLDMLDQAWMSYGQPRPVGGVVHDVGASNFWYARALHTFFQPVELTGVEVEGYRIYSNGYSRWDYAQGYVQGLSGTKFLVADYAGYVAPADTIVAWYPFVTPVPVLAWRMPLGLFAPQALFSRLASNLNLGGLFVMVNQGLEEAECAAGFCREAGLLFRSSCQPRALLRARRMPPVISIWSRG